MEDVMRVFLSLGPCKKSWTHHASSYPWLASKIKRWNLLLILRPYPWIKPETSHLPTLPPSHLFHLPNVTLLPPFQFSQPHYPPTFPFSQLHYPPTFPRFPTLPSSNLSHLLNLTTSHIQLKHSKITSLGLLSPHIVF